MKVRTANDADFLKSMDGLEGFDFWSMSRILPSTTTVMVIPEHQQMFEKSLVERNIEFKILIKDLDEYKVIKKFFHLNRCIIRIPELLRPNVDFN